MGFKPALTLVKQFTPAAKTIDQQPFDERPLHRAEQIQCAHDLREHASPFNVCHENAMRS